jgi:hypothetical protein
MAVSRRTIKVGVIAEEDNDVDVVHVLLKKITPRRSFCIRSFVGHGCGKLRYKGRVWASQLANRGCSVLLFIHDLDRQRLNQLRTELEEALKPCPIQPYLIVIPIEELEAWLLADANALRGSFNLKKRPKSVANPESIADPKRFLEAMIWSHSEKKKRYVNTIHNVRIAEHIDVSALRKCSAFRPFEKFWADLKAA